MMAFQEFSSGRHYFRRGMRNRLPGAPTAKVTRNGENGRKLVFSLKATSLLTSDYIQVYADEEAGSVAITLSNERKGAWKVYKYASNIACSVSLAPDFPIPGYPKFSVCPSDIEGFDLILTTIEETEKP